MSMLQHTSRRIPALAGNGETRVVAFKCRMLAVPGF